jgi:hypothetical protein
MSSAATPRTIPFTGLKGLALSQLLQLGFVRYRRVQLGFAEFPEQYKAFLATVVGARLEGLPGKVGIFGSGAHTGLLLETIPGLDARVACLIDNNQSLWRQSKFGHVVLPPSEAIRECEVIVLSTAVYQHVLRADLKKLGFAGAIVAMDDVVPPSWFLAA